MRCTHMLLTESVAMLCYRVSQCTKCIRCVPADPSAVLGVRCLPGHHVQWQWHTIEIKTLSEEWFPRNQRMSGTKRSILSPLLHFHLPTIALRMIPTDLPLHQFQFAQRVLCHLPVQVCECVCLNYRINCFLHFRKWIMWRLRKTVWSQHSKNTEFETTKRVLTWNPGPSYQ
jgi:hypothetical protein